MFDNFLMSKNRSFLLAVLFVLCLSISASAQLPSAVASRVKKIDASINAVEQALEKDQLTTAKRKLNEAGRTLKEITDRYKGKFEENDPVYAAMSSRFEKATAAVAAAEGQAGAAKESVEAAKKAKEEQSKHWIERFTPFLDRNSGKDLPIGATLNSLSEEGQAAAKAAAKEAQALFNEYQNAQFPHGKTYELTNLESTIADRLSYYSGMEQSDAQEESCAQWVDLLSPYAEVGRGSPKLLINSTTMDSAEIENRQKLYDEAKGAFEAYKKADFPHGKTHRLQQIEKLLEQKIAEMPDYLEKSRAMVSGDIEQRLDNIITHFDSNSSWKNDETTKPPTIMERDLAPLRAAVEEYAAKATDSDSSLNTLRTKLAKIQEMDKEHRVIWGQRTFQQPDAYTGNDIELLKEEAKRAALKTHSGATISYVTVTSADWAIEDVVEFTDTTRSALHRRITRTVNAQISLKTAAGEVLLQGVSLGQNKLADGNWGKLQGHTTWKDPLAEANIGKFAKK